MESPVRICIGAVAVVILLLVSSIEVNGNVVPQANNATAPKDEKISRHTRSNSTLLNNRHKSKIPDVALNELNPKVTTSEENTEKNAKYKDRGRVRFNIQPKTTSESPLKRVTSTKGPSVIIVTPTPEVKKPAQIIDSMHKYKKSKITSKNVSSTSPSVSDKIETQSQEDFDNEEDESFEKYTSSKFDDNFFSFPSFNDDDDDTKSSKSESKSDYGYSTPFSFKNYFSKDNYVSKEDSYKSNYFDFDTDLTTPRNDFFDKKYEEISKSILKNLDTIKSKAPAPNVTNVHKLNVGFETMSNDTPTNKSTMFFKNTKEVRYLDNEHAGTANKELSDVQGTSIYYEMTVLSTETYNINKDTDDDDCDENMQTENTKTSAEPTQPTKVDIPIRKYPDPDTSGSVSQASSNILPETVRPPNSMPISTQRILSYSFPPTTNPKIFSSSYNRNKTFAKRLNFANLKDSPNSVTSLGESTHSETNRQQIRRFHQTTPRIKPKWMAPRKNINRTTVTRIPMTIYSEHFDIKDQFTTTKRPPQSTKPVLTTFASEIDPVLQSDVGGVKKVVHSPSISDNTIPSLSKRGSTKFSANIASSTASTSTEAQTGLSDLEIPPTLTAWALASLRSPPPSSSSANATETTQKSVDENELQKVGEITDMKPTSTMSTTSTTLSTTTVSEGLISKNATEIDENASVIITTTTAATTTAATTTSATITTVMTDINLNQSISEPNSERLAAESIISIQSSKKPLIIEPIKAATNIKVTTVSNLQEGKTTWISATEILKESTDKETNESSGKQKIPPIDTTKSTGFESITKLPSGVTTPKDDVIVNVDEKQLPATVKESVVPTTTDYEITTIRFSYKPKAETTETTVADEEQTDENTVWHSAFPTTTEPTSDDDIEITTYRPKFVTTTETNEEITTNLWEPTTSLISQHLVDNKTENIVTTTEATDEETTTSEITTMLIHSEETSKETTTFKLTIPVETTTIIVSVATEINTERATLTPTESPTTIYTTETNAMQSDSGEIETSEENSESNEVIEPANKATTAPAMETTTKAPVETKTINVPTTTESKPIKVPTTTEDKTTTDTNERIVETTTQELTTESDYMTTKSVNDLEDLTSFAGDMTTENSSRVLTEEAGSGAAIAIAVSTIGVIALVLLIGLLLVVRRRGRRGVYAQRCTPVSLDAYSLDSVSVGHRKGQRLRASKRSYGNPAYDDEVTSHPMNYAALANFALDIDSITSEFAEIPSVTVRPEEVPPGCEDKNRYSNVLPLPETRVPLKRIGNDPTTEYINANFVMGPGNIRNFYILCQAPLANTVVDFWRMMWEQNSRLIVMLTEYMENGVEKCYEYLPPSEISDNRRTFGNFQIILKKREQRDKYAISSVQLINLATRTWREVTHLWYFWPAKGVPDDYDSVIDFLFEMRSYMKVSQTAKEYDEEGVEIIYEEDSSYNNLSKLREENGSGHSLNVYSPAKAEEKLRKPTNGTLAKKTEGQTVRPCVVMCASGAGRSAALVAAEECARALAAGRADVPRVVRRLRAQRPHSLTNRHHYMFLYKLLSEYGNKLMGGGVDAI
ncbi:serine-rich adhesin for platelets [Aricia agestis]|uniref:serine-rich adhesin for platelets n=1 Tax=Aricia agestis TaxID=91739 RepID=UPI001C204AEC|nr:serine-rich adhesin for platelets [Aricia agestis]XP_041980813.1 serine-rich adhesin for platelets [Aricia agestis]XP_041980814.1 serine-rich adhesin for platelets [Aricia agestis]